MKNENISQALGSDMRLNINFPRQDDLDFCFENLNILLEKGKPPALKELHFNSDITPIKQQDLESQPSTFRDPYPLATSYDLRHPIPTSKQDNPLLLDEETARMREMLLSTQQDIDRIIQGSDNIAQIYTQSKLAAQPSLFHSQQPAVTISGSQPPREVDLSQ